MKRKPLKYRDSISLIIEWAYAFAFGGFMLWLAIGVTKLFLRANGA